MREILFRGKRLDNGEWVKGYYIKATHHWHNHGIHEDWIAVDTIQNGGWCNVRGKYAVIPETVGQYTGLTDKNGTKIFYGDIVQVISTLSDNGKHIVVRFDCKRGGWFPFANGDGCGCCEYETYAPNGDGVVDCVELVGNIHDNPELLGTE